MSGRGYSNEPDMNCRQYKPSKAVEDLKKILKEKEGEFKKRIDAMSHGLEPWVQAEDEGSSILCPHQYNINLKEVIDILEEMKKEVFQFDRTIVDLPPEEWWKFGVAAVNAVLEINKKLVKWLGEKDET